ncbi:MFS transporter [Plantactinospora sp. CA-290183]|uniref:MFS transporter n=1 Tax=Plantactinospora sp. CA-290183 TaxID=3240006 RepID=UPI003D8C90A6
MADFPLISPPPVTSDLPARRPGRTVAGATATTIACVLPVFLVGGLAVQLGAELRFSPAGLGLAVAVYFGVSALASVPSGALVERYGPARTARAGILLAAATMLAIAVLARSYAALVGLLAVGAGANALGQLASNTALARGVPAGRQGLSFGLKQAAIPMATLLAGAAVPTVALTAGWRWAFVIAAGLALATLPLVPPDSAPGGRETGRQARRASGALVVLGAAATLAAGGANALGTFVVDSAAVRGLSPALAGLVLTFGGTLCVFGRVGAGWWADRRTGGYVGIIAGMLVVGAGGLGLLTLSGPVPLVVGVTLGFGIGWAWPGLLNLAVVRLHPQAPAAATSITQTGVYLGGCLGPLGFGTVAAHIGYPTMWTAAAGALLGAAGLMLVGRRMLLRNRNPAPAPAALGRPSGAGSSG